MADAQPHVLVDVVDGVATVTLNRPERRHAMSPEMVVRLARAWRDLNDDAAVSAVVLTAAPGPVFCAGADLARLIPLFTGARVAEDEWDRELLADRRAMDVALLRGVDFYKPVVAAVTGKALAGGTEILLGTDLRVASTDATFALTEVRRGIVPGGGSLVRLARQIPYAAAMEILLVGEPISAVHALSIGLVNRVVPPDDVLPTAVDLARRIALGAPFALRKAKEAVVTTSGVPLPAAYKIENACAREVMATDDAREGPRAFVEKREPVWAGR